MGQSSQTPYVYPPSAVCAQVALRWVVQQGVVVATSPGTNADYIAGDLDLGSFVLTQAEMAELSSI